MMSDPRALFADLLSGQEIAMLVDGNGLVVAGAYPGHDGRDVAHEVSAALTGVSDEAYRATRHLNVGAWRSIVFETENAFVSLSPCHSERSEESAARSHSERSEESAAAVGMLVVAASIDTPLGALARTTARCVARASAWLSGAPS
jgi:hypothetical protein